MITCVQNVFFYNIHVKKKHLQKWYVKIYKNHTVKFPIILCVSSLKVNLIYGKTDISKY